MTTAPNSLNATHHSVGAVNNISDLCTELCSAFRALGNGNLEVKAASEMANLAGKAINTTKVQIEYYALIGKKDVKIKFIEGGN